MQSACAILPHVACLNLPRFSTLSKKQHDLREKKGIEHNVPVYFPTNALRDTVYITHIKTPACFGTRMPSSGINSKEGVRANLLVYVLFIV
jgi:hypothetical protein